MYRRNTGVCDFFKESAAFRTVSALRDAFDERSRRVPASQQLQNRFIKHWFIRDSAQLTVAEVSFQPQ